MMLPGEVNVLGDIVISLEQAALQSEEFGHSLGRELGYLVAAWYASPFRL